MAGETVVTIVGNLTADPELRTTSTGASVCGFTIASTPRAYNRQSGQWEDGQPLFLRCSAWRDLADHCASSLAKGMRVIAQGRLQQRSYQAQDGSNRTVLEMQVDEIGPSLRYATAQVQRRPSGQGPAGRGNAGYTGGAGAWGQPPQQDGQPQQASQPPQTAEDPWATSQPASPFGGSGRQDDEPAF